MSWPVDAQDPPWARLLQWLQGHGMNISSDHLLVERRKIPGVGYGLFATVELNDSTRLFTVPASALINKKTLEGTYGSSLSAVQMISLHLALHQPHPGECSRDELFGPYISILPQEFDSHPLTWVVKRHWYQPLSVIEQSLLDRLPPSIEASLKSMLERFIADWNTCREYCKSREHPHLSKSCDSLLDGSLPEALLWGWLNVNTRCIYHRLYPKQSNPDNITLCPILDFANHSSTCAPMMPNEMPTWKGLSLVSPRGNRILAGDELFLRYGTHPNRKLFVEYGFLDTSNTSKEVEIQDLLETRVSNSFMSGEIRSVLESNGYWGDWTLHTQPEPAHPSYRVISALRLICLLLDDSGTADPRPWKETIAGIKDNISEANEVAWRELLGQICDAIHMRANSNLEASPINANTNWASWMQGNVRALWEEEALTARMVLDSLEDGTIEA